MLLNHTIFETRHIGDHVNVRVVVFEKDLVFYQELCTNSILLLDADNWGRGSTHTITCTGENGDGQIEVELKIE